MKATLEKWNKYWQNMKLPLHRYETSEHYQSYASELKVLFSNQIPQTVLELGCGNGALYQYLGFKDSQYKGVDFSSTMLDEFKGKYPHLDLENGDASSYCDANKYDLIISIELAQYFDIDMMNQHFANARKMVHENSLFICAGIPWKKQRFKYRIGQLSEKEQSVPLKVALSYFKCLFNEQLGDWYDFSDIRKLCKKYDFSVNFYGSMNYMYRFHAVIKQK
ncbi:class I SAM-dependent methyltransferase [Sphaerospermopsis aphanizomenoides BCCUSP55]|uniref:class I SAM-dependent methyltransferase n=1 Tax=Sphaerospermopsis aphanizomenoides TaxID=459663 RepID=UPI001904148B|nr:class I SAM-dependent methyltransferase [Sphaerospermopsis aphanizomenoides]MBK1988484.1 class I SAM-dependent methyltransferase [Sphaerospermopsis aphanizomenoides BCCUSP55]